MPRVRALEIDRARALHDILEVARELTQEPRTLARRHDDLKRACAVALQARRDLGHAPRARQRALLARVQRQHDERAPNCTHAARELAPQHVVRHGRALAVLVHDEQVEVVEDGRRARGQPRFPRLDSVKYVEEFIAVHVRDEGVGAAEEGSVCAAARAQQVGVGAGSHLGCWHDDLPLDIVCRLASPKLKQAHSASFKIMFGHEGAQARERDAVRVREGRSSGGNGQRRCAALAARPRSRVGRRSVRACRRARACASGQRGGSRKGAAHPRSAAASAPGAEFFLSPPFGEVCSRTLRPTLRNETR